MTDREVLIKILGMAEADDHVMRSRPIRELIGNHFKGRPTPERLSLEDRVKTLERIVTSRGYQIDEQLAETA